MAEKVIETVEVIKTKNIFEAQLACMEEVSYIKKEKVQGLRYSVMSESEVISQCRPVLMKYKVVGPVCTSSEVFRMQDIPKVEVVWQLFTGVRRFRFTHVPSDTHDEIEVFAQDQDGNGKAANKAMTVAKRYALREWLLLETGDDPYEDVEEDSFYDRACAAISESTDGAGLDKIAAYIEKNKDSISGEQIVDLQKRLAFQLKVTTG